jgi:hypothetical protein
VGAIAVRDGRVAPLLQNNFAATDVGRPGSESCAISTFTTTARRRTRHDRDRASSRIARDPGSGYCSFRRRGIVAPQLRSSRAGSTAVVEPLKPRGDHPDERPTDMAEDQGESLIALGALSPGAGSQRPSSCRRRVLSGQDVQGTSSSGLGRLGSTRHRSSLPESASPSANCALPDPHTPRHHPLTSEPCALTIADPSTAVKLTIALATNRSSARTRC